ncbi:MarR family winged helix-turn-helix transcriptional regulator [Paludisphaera mucosa]|uniref:MarR family transcriptional regulator n=1 Tax=Paludisphaera mucosa TaxID=3030827 RepID=A0ABT6FC96_9BACT|nr:MarR family transcriptional regulator [Paludisphaera mucosa]MDG3005023.1 MarR family transcriptional regulator [Paludisphaera mucosa]
MTSERPSGLEDHLGYWLRRLSNRVSRGFSDRLERRGVTVAQWVVLRCLYDAEGASLLILAATVGVDGGAMSRMVERLAKKGLVVRAADPTDRRAVSIRLTEAGRTLVPVLAREADENDDAFFGVVGEPERRRLLASLKSILAKHEAGDEFPGKTLD